MQSYNIEAFPNVIFWLPAVARLYGGSIFNMLPQRTGFVPSPCFLCVPLRFCGLMADIPPHTSTYVTPSVTGNERALKNLADFAHAYIFALLSQEMR
jgi:hypothetical protein